MKNWLQSLVFSSNKILLQNSVKKFNKTDETRDSGQEEKGEKMAERGNLRSFLLKMSRMKFFTLCFVCERMKRGRKEVGQERTLEEYN